MAFYDSFSFELLTHAKKCSYVITNRRPGNNKYIFRPGIKQKYECIYDTFSCELLKEHKTKVKC